MILRIYLVWMLVTLSKDTNVFFYYVKGGEQLERVHDIFRSLNIIDIFNTAQFKVASFVSGGVGTFLSLVYGKTNLIWIFILMMVVALDWITGSKASKLDGSYSSAYGVEGIARTVVLFLLPCLAHMFDIVFDLLKVLLHYLSNVRSAYNSHLPKWS